jgi:hypothetical protein
MPPGVDERQNGGISPYHDVFQDRFNQRYLKLVRKYSDIIVGQFFGHLHSDTFRIVYSDTGKMSVRLSYISLFLLPVVGCRMLITLQPGREIPLSAEAFHGSGKKHTVMVMFVCSTFVYRPNYSCLQSTQSQQEVLGSTKRILSFRYNFFYNYVLFLAIFTNTFGARGSIVVKVLHYRPEGHRLETGFF